MDNKSSLKGQSHMLFCVAIARNQAPDRGMINILRLTVTLPLASLSGAAAAARAPEIMISRVVMPQLRCAHSVISGRFSPAGPGRRARGPASPPRRLRLPGSSANSGWLFSEQALLTAAESGQEYSESIGHGDGEKGV